MNVAAHAAVVMLLLTSSLTACGPSGDDLATMDAATAQAKATEIPFEPTQAWIRCSAYAHMGTAITLWEHAGLRPVDSMPTSDKGRDVGALRECTPVRLLDRQWSIYNEAFYYLVEGEGQRGWVIEPVIVFEEPQNLQLSPSATE